MSAVWITKVDRQPGGAGSLAGLTFAVKDNIDVAGVPTTAACPEFAYVPDRSSPVVQRLVDAGAAMIGKTNLDQFATGLTGMRSPYGTPESVFGGGLISGGSSSGSAVAVAAGEADFALGTDTAGSGRVPAALNGIVGVKPTRGRLSTEGVVPACRTLDCVSIFTRDVALATKIMSILAPGRPSIEEPRLKAGLDLDFFGDTGQEKAFAGRFGDLPTVDIAPMIEAGDLLYGPWVAERLADLEPHLDLMLPVTRAVVESGRRYSAADLFRAQHRLRELKSWTDRLWQDVDVLVLPTIGTTYTQAEVAADPIALNLNLGRYTQFANLLDLAAVTLPNGFTAEGRPASVTLLGPAHSDETLLRLAASMDEPTTTLAVVGLHLSGEPRNNELVDRGATFVTTARTAPCYRLYRLPSGVPGLVRQEEGAQSDGEQIEVELWQLPSAAVGSLLAGVKAPLGFGRVLLADGSEVTGFLCEAYAVAEKDAQDITASGGWRNFRAEGQNP
jgi:allophanate hydrolase